MIRPEVNESLNLPARQAVQPSALAEALRPVLSDRRRPARDWPPDPDRRLSSPFLAARLLPGVRGSGLRTWVRNVLFHHRYFSRRTRIPFRNISIKVDEV